METQKNESTLRAEQKPREDGVEEASPANGERPASGPPPGRSGSERDKGRRDPGRAQLVANNTRRLRMERMMSKAELARRAGVSILTIDRVERGMKCRMDTKRKIIEALGLRPEDRAMVFAEDE
ncbi:MAG: helix-turn-helix transcriptional regulator [Myxococcales bacterium]|nr:helix-turn-helix transcriptional regulator [Myxococcales bacterium]